MLTAEEMVQFCEENNTGSGFTKNQRLKHFKVIEQQLQDGEDVLGCFMGIHNYISMSKHDNNYAYAITPNRIIAAQKKVIGDTVQIISRKQLNDVTKSTGLMMGLLTFDTLKEQFNVKVDKAQTNAIHSLIVHQLFNEETGTVTINNVDSGKSAAEQLKEFKELLDLDIISQEEFDVKKAELLS